MGSAAMKPTSSAFTSPLAHVPPPLPPPRVADVPPSVPSSISRRTATPPLPPPRDRSRPSGPPPPPPRPRGPPPPLPSGPSPSSRPPGAPPMAPPPTRSARPPSPPAFNVTRSAPPPSPGSPPPPSMLNSSNCVNQNQQIQEGSQPITILRNSSQSWFWQDDDGAWKPFDVSAGSIDSDEIEQSYQQHNQGSFSFSLRGCSYVIQFSSNIQTNITTSRQRKVERRLVQLDWYWQDDDGQWKQYDSTSGGVSSAQITTNVTTGKTRCVECRSSSISPTQQIPVLPSSHDWYWQGNDQTWHLFGGSISSDFIEAKFAANPSDSFTFKHGDYSYRIDLSTMTQTNLGTCKKRPIVRTPKGVAPQPVSFIIIPPPSVPPRIPIPSAQPKTAYPSTWDLNVQADNYGVALVDVQPSGPTAREFNTVSKLFNKSMPDTALKSVTRVQNKQLWEKFDLAKKTAGNTARSREGSSPVISRHETREYQRTVHTRL